MDNPNPAAAGPAAPAARPVLLDRKGHVYQPAIGPRLKVVLAVIFAAVAVLGATGAYLLTITGLNWLREPRTYTNQFTLWMILIHILVGVALVVPFLFFGLTHLTTARTRPNRRAVRLGIVLFVFGCAVGLSGLLLIQLHDRWQLPSGTVARAVAYWAHVVAPLLAVLVYVLHRRAGPDIKWSWGGAWGAGVAVFVLAMVGLHSQDPRQWYAVGSPEGRKYFEPSDIVTANGKFIPAETLMMDEYCLKCHKDIYNDHYHSAHKFSSFNNPMYLFSVKETREVGMKRDGNVRGSRWCAGCHDTVPFLSGQFDDPQYDIVNHPTAHAGITCTVCHAVTNINSPIGNASMTIEEPLHYPFATSDNALLQWLNNQLVKAKPDFHKKTFLKPFHRSAEFCSTCHKVSLPVQLNHYKEFLRGQNHYDTYLLSGVSGVGVRSFYYPPVAKTRCADCHMPLNESDDFGSRDFDGSGKRKVHHHSFPGANTGLMWVLANDPKHAEHAEGFRKAFQRHANFLRGTAADGSDKKLRIDLFGLKEGGTIDGKLHAPLRPELPKLRPGQTYLVEAVIRTVNMGHPFPQGTADSNEIWVDFQASSGGKVFARSGAMTGDDRGKVDEWSHFVNMLLLDRNGNRINRRNPQDIFVPLYDHQVPPGAGQVVHYSLKVPEDVKGPVELKVRLRYRKFDFEYLSLVYGGDDKVPTLPIIDICEDEVTLPVAGVAEQVPAQTSPIKPAWQRWNDYGIGCFLEGGPDGKNNGELGQAEEAFKKLLDLGDKDARPHAYLNLARVHLAYGGSERLSEATKVLNLAREGDPKAPWWTVAWFTGRVNTLNDHLDKAVESYEQILDPANRVHERQFDFTRDYVAINELAKTLFALYQASHDPREGERFLLRAVERYERVLEIDPENLDAHYGLMQCYQKLGEAMPEVSDVAAVESPVDREALAVLAESFAATKEPPARQLQAVRMARRVLELGREPLKPDNPKLRTLQAVRTHCRTAFATESDPPVRTAAAHVLGHVHREIHTIYKPDDNARDRALALYRQKHPAADHASQTVVIYPTDKVVK